MPNGIEGDLAIAAGATVSVGDGLLVCGGDTITLGPVWDPVPQLADHVVIGAEPRIDIDVDRLAGCGPGLTPLGDDVLVGWLAGLALRGVDGVSEIATHAAARTTALSGTLLRLAAHGALAEPAHAFVERGDIDPLLHFGSTSGAGIALGLVLGLSHGDAHRAFDDGAVTTAFVLPLADGTKVFEITVNRRVRSTATGVTPA